MRAAGKLIAHVWRGTAAGALQTFEVPRFPSQKFAITGGTSLNIRTEHACHPCMGCGDGRWPPVELFEDADKVFFLVRQQLCQRDLPVILIFRQNHFPHRVDAIAGKKHVLGPA